jgi:hypothetical protein
MIPAERRVDGFSEFSTASLVDATAVNPNVLQLILPSLISAKLDFLKA